MLGCYANYYDVVGLEMPILFFVELLIIKCPYIGYSISEIVCLLASMVKTFHDYKIRMKAFNFQILSSLSLSLTHFLSVLHSFASHQWNRWVKRVTMSTLLPCRMHWVCQSVLCTLTAAHVIVVVSV